MITLQSQINDQSDRLDTHSDLLSNILGRLRVLEESGASSQEPGVTPGVWYSTSQRVPERYDTVVAGVIENGVRLVLAHTADGAWYRSTGGERIDAPAIWTCIPDLPEGY